MENAFICIRRLIPVILPFLCGHYRHNSHLCLSHCYHSYRFDSMLLSTTKTSKLTNRNFCCFLLLLSYFWHTLNSFFFTFPIVFCYACFFLSFLLFSPYFLFIFPFFCVFLFPDFAANKIQSVSTNPVCRFAHFVVTWMTPIMTIRMTMLNYGLKLYEIDASNS